MCIRDSIADPGVWTSTALACKRQDDAGEGERDAAEMSPAQLFARHAPVQPEHGQARSGIEKDDHARSRRVGEPKVDEEELDREQQPREETHAQGAVVLPECQATPARPEGQEQQRDSRAQPRLEHRADTFAGDLDADLLVAPGRAEQDHQGKGGETGRRSLFHQPALGVPRFSGVRSASDTGARAVTAP